MRDASSDKNRIIKNIHLNLLCKISMDTKKICNMSTQLSVVEITKLSFGFPNVMISNKGVSHTFDNYAAELQVPFEKSAASVIIFNPDVSNNFENNYDHAPVDTAESQVLVEKIAAENDSFSLRIADPSGNDISLYMMTLYRSLCGGDLLEIFIDMKLDEALTFSCILLLHHGIRSRRS